MRRIRRRALATVLGVGMTLGVFAVPAAADPPPSSGVVERFITEDFGIFLDFENGFWVFANITRQGFCDWVEGGEVGPPPALTTSFSQQVSTPAGAVVVLGKPGVDPFALHRITSPFDPCAGSEPDPWATGEMNVIATDNDFFLSGGRTNSFGVHWQGTVFEVATGEAYHYSFHVRLQITKDGEFRVVNERFTLKKKGN